jgi:predicted ArsR family transcriptional regulator
MDPNQALRDALDGVIEYNNGLHEHGRDECIEALENLLDWLKHEGFMPKVQRIDPHQPIYRIGD